MSLHPFYPVHLQLSAYNGRVWSMMDILGVFFAVLGLALAVSWGAISNSPHHSSRRPSFGTRGVFLWFIACGLIHSITEGYFAYNNRSIVSDSSFLGELWKEYALSDSRYLTSDPTVLVIESLTSAFWGPLSFVNAYLIYKNEPSRHLLQMVISFGQFYGDVVYYLSTLLEGAPHCRPEPFYFWFYFVFMNFWWLLIPGLIMANSGYEIVKALNGANARGAVKVKYGSELDVNKEE